MKNIDNQPRLTTRNKVGLLIRFLTVLELSCWFYYGYYLIYYKTKAAEQQHIKKGLSINILLFWLTHIRYTVYLQKYIYTFILCKNGYL